ncbi:MAG: HAD family hydrolase [Pleurocapsa sp.]
MVSKPILKAITDNRLGDIRLLATDLDGTLTLDDKFSSGLIRVLERLKQSNIQVLIVTGRSAGWVSAIATYLPLVGAIAENGGLLFWSNGAKPQILTPIANIEAHRQKLRSTFQLLQNKFPQIQESQDNCFRITDWTFDVRDLNQDELQQIDRICRAEGWGFTYSTVQCHIKPPTQDKAIALELILQRYYPHLKLEQIITLGDSPNDESLFQPKFPFSVGVANILDYRDRLQHLPVYVTQASEASGFIELAELVINTNKPA